MATFSVTDRQTFKRCRRKWDFSSNARQNLTKIGPGHKALELGGIIHRALAVWLLNEDTKLSDAFKIETLKRKKEIEDKYLAVVGMPISDEELGPFYDFVELGIAMCDNYQKVYNSPLPDSMQFAAAEQEIIVPVPGTEHYCNNCVKYNRELGIVTLYSDTVTSNPKSDCKECGGTGTAYHYLSATLDGLLQHRHNKKFYVLERKTYDQRPKREDLEMADQFTGYCWVVTQLDPDIEVGGIAYDGLWKRATLPRGVKSVNDLFTRVIINKTPMEIEEWGRNLALEINEMANDPELYPTVPWNGCWDCTFREPCKMMMLGEDPSDLLRREYTQREVVRIQGIKDVNDAE